MMRARLSLWLLLGIVFLASVSVSVGFAYWEKENPSYDKCLTSCDSEKDAYKYHACQARCKLTKDDPEEQRREREERERQGQEEERPRREEQQERQPWRERERQREEEGEEERDPREQRQHRQEKEQERRRQEQGREQERDPRREKEREGEEEEQQERDPREQRQQHRQQKREREAEEEEQEERDPREERRHQQEREEREQERRRQEQRGEREDEEEEQERDPREERRRQQEREEREQERRRQEQRREREGEEEEQERDPREQRRRQQEKEQREQEEEGERRGRRHRDDPEERARERQREQRREQRREEEKERQREEQRRREEKGQRREKEEPEGERQRPRNPFHFKSKRFQTRYKNEHGQISVLQRFDKRSKQLQNLQNYRLVVFESKPNTLILPHHSDAEYVLVVLDGKATLTAVNPNDRESYNVECGSVLRIPAGTTTYVVNRDDEENLKVAKLAIPVNRPGQFEEFFPSGSQNRESYFSGFRKDTLEAAFNTQYEEIQRILLGEEEEEKQQQQQRRGKEKEQSQQEEGLIVKVSKEQIKELSKHAKSIPSGSKQSKSGPFNLRSLSPYYSNKYGKFFEATPEKTPLLQDLGISVSYTELYEGSLFLPHYNSEAIALAFIHEGKGELEIVGVQGRKKSREQKEEGREEEQEKEQEEEEEEEEEEQEEERSGKVHSITAKLSENDAFVTPAAYPVAINASSDLHILTFNLNAENNQRNFLAGEKDNVIKQIERLAKELAFPGSGEDVDKLIKNQKDSYFANAQAQQEEGKEGKRGSLSSILRAIY